eukprot:g656.t1
MASWFEDTFGFKEKDAGGFAGVRSRFRLEDDGETLVTLGRRFHVGKFETPTVRDLLERVDQGAHGAGDGVDGTGGGLRFTHDTGDVRARHVSGAVIQAASQFNCLEMVGPRVTPEAGITCYWQDRTQGPICALQCPAGTLFRNYFAGPGCRGQAGPHQLDCLADMGAALGNDGERYWTMSNGYALPARPGSIGEVGERIRADTALAEEARARLRVGVQWSTEVQCRRDGGGGAAAAADAAGAADAAPRVTQVYCSAVPVAYAKGPGTRDADWEPLARLVLLSTYQATLAVAALVSRARGGGAASVFRNAPERLIKQLADALVPGGDSAALAAPLLAAARLGPAVASAAPGSLDSLSQRTEEALRGMTPTARVPTNGLENGVLELNLHGALLMAHGVAAGEPDFLSEEGTARAQAVLAAVRRLRTAGESGCNATFRAASGASSRYMQWLGLTSAGGSAGGAGPGWGGAELYGRRRGVWLTDALQGAPCAGFEEQANAWAWSLVDAVSAAAQAQDADGVRLLLDLLGGGSSGGAARGAWDAAAAEARRHSSPALSLAQLDLAAAQLGDSWECGSETIAHVAEAGAEPGEQALALAHTWLASLHRCDSDGEWCIDEAAATVALDALHA